MNALFSIEEALNTLCYLKLYIWKTVFQVHGRTAVSKLQVYIGKNAKGVSLLELLQTPKDNYENKQ